MQASTDQHCAGSMSGQRSCGPLAGGAVGVNGLQDTSACAGSTASTAAPSPAASKSVVPSPTSPGQRIIEDDTCLVTHPDQEKVHASIFPAPDVSSPRQPSTAGSVLMPMSEELLDLFASIDELWAEVTSVAAPIGLPTARDPLMACGEVRPNAGGKETELCVDPGLFVTCIAPSMHCKMKCCTNDMPKSRVCILLFRCYMRQSAWSPL